MRRRVYNRFSAIPGAAVIGVIVAIIVMAAVLVWRIQGS